MANQGTADFDTSVFALFFRLPLKDSPAILLGTRIELFVKTVQYVFKHKTRQPHRSNCIYLQDELLKFKMSIRIKIYCEIKCAMVAGTC